MQKSLKQLGKYSQKLNLMGSYERYAHALLPYLNLHGLYYPLTITTDWLKLKLVRLNAIVDTPNAVNQSLPWTIGVIHHVKTLFK